MSANPTQSTGSAVPIVAIGASAGGLEACRALLKALPEDIQYAFVLILHLDPSHDSMMVELLARDTGLTVAPAAEGKALRPGHLYVIPPGVFLTVADGVLHTTAPESGKSVRLPFDVLLQSLAKSAQFPLACIVMSGTGTDGSGGLGAIRAAGGLILAQDPDEASHSGMPQSAIETGLVDYILRIKDMPAVLGQLANGSTRRPPCQGTKDSARAAPHRSEARPIEPDAKAKRGFDAILDLVAQTAPQDVTLYKSGTIQRRIARRMAIAGCSPDEADRYLAMLHADAAECAQLSADLLIHVTSFFRDPAVFEHLERVALPALLATQPSDRPLRVWVAGCSTGEEAYSLAMLCIEAMETAGSQAGLQVFASDVDPDAVATARDGFYPDDIEASVSPERLARFFMPEGGGWRVRPELRDVIVFTVADLLSDPPFSRIDLLSCRNVLIYLEAEAQRRVIALCCFALRQGGLLLLGSAEAPGAAQGRFELADKAARLWRRVGQSRPEDLHFMPGTRSGKPHETPPLTNRPTALAELCRRIVLENYAPAAILMTRQLECLYLLGPTQRYLKVAEGHPAPGFLGMLPRTLREKFRDAAAVCDASNPLVLIPGAHSPQEGRFNIELRAVTAGAEQYLLACFVQAPRIFAPTPSDEASADAEVDATRVFMLEAELEATREDLRDALSDLESEVEVHASDSAEALSVNEEFQSTNEELLASKEELQALNEELTALNGQLQETLERYRTTANDLQNVLYSTDVATLFLDLDLNIRFFTPAARAVFRVIATDIGRPLADLAAISSDEHLAADAASVLTSSGPIEREISGLDGVWYLRRIQPYRADGGRVEGVVITFIDITERKRTHAALVAAKREADRATVAKSRFLAAASHDLRQPLQSLALLHGMMTRDRRNGEALRLSNLMDRTLNSMTEMLDSLLDVNRIESGIVRPELRAVAIAPLMARIGEEFAPQCEQKGLKLRVVRCKAWVRTDPRLLEQMLRNLLSNALKYTAKGGILMGCRVNGDRLTIQVRDSGIGVAQAEQGKIFDAYHQAEKADFLAGRGLGLGLSIVQRLADLLDHPVTVRSAPDKGSTFMVTLPVVAAQDVGPTETPPAQADATRRTGTILLVEDEDDLRQLLVELLESAGHSVIAAANAHDALAFAAGTMDPPDLLLTDFDLPGSTSGLLLAQDLPDVLSCHVPTIILTDDITTETMQHIAATPFDQISKPVPPEVLLDRISTLLHGSASAAQAEPTARSVATDQTTLHVVDDDPMVCETTRRLFEAEGWNVATHRSAEDFLAGPRPGAGACLVVDGLLPGMSGVELLKALRAENSALPAVMLTGHGDISMAVSAMKAGAVDLIEKPASAADLLASVAHAVARATDERARNSARRAAQKAFADLTPRERDVLSKVLEGAPNKIIAADLGINQRTVENHRASVMRKTGAASLPELVRMAIAAGPPVAA